MDYILVQSKISFGGEIITPPSIIIMGPDKLKIFLYAEDY